MTESLNDNHDFTRDEFSRGGVPGLNGAFKGRGRHYAPLLACPVDGAALVQRDAALHCTAHAGHVYPVENGIVRLVPHERRHAVHAESESYEAARRSAGWHSPDEAQFKSLPQTGLPGYPPDYWPQHAASTALLWRFLEAIRLRNGGLPVGPIGEAVIVGAGLGWLAYALDVAGYTTVALDTRAGDEHGLGVYPIARYLRVQADLAYLPLAPAAFDGVIFQEGLAGCGADDVRQAVFERALRALRPGGWLAVMDSLSPSPDRAQATQALLEDAGLRLMAVSRRQGWRGTLLTLRDRLIPRDAPVPPVIVAQKPAM